MWAQLAIFCCVSVQLVVLLSLQACISAAENQTRVELVLVRHSVSCSNMLKWHGENQTWRERDGDYADPLLSDLGLDDARALASLAATLHPDFVGSSRLMRAMETAHILFPERDVHVWPHIDEMDEKNMFRSLAVEDLPLPSAVQDKILAERWGSAKWVIRDGHWKDAGLIGLEHFLLEVVPTMPALPRLRLLAVTHSDTMRWDPLLNQHVGWLHWPMLPWANSVQAFEVHFDIVGSKILMVGKPRALWHGFHQKHDVLNCSQVTRCDPDFMAHVVDGSGNLCSQAVKGLGASQALVV